MKIKKLLISTLICLTTSLANAQNGSWSGELNIQGMKLPLVFNFTDNGCTIDSPSQGAKGIKADVAVTESLFAYANRLFQFYFFLMPLNYNKNVFSPNNYEKIDK